MTNQELFILPCGGSSLCGGSFGLSGTASVPTAPVVVLGGCCLPPVWLRFACRPGSCLCALMGGGCHLRSRADFAALAVVYLLFNDQQVAVGLVLRGSVGVGSWYRECTDLPLLVVIISVFVTYLPCSPSP